MTEDQADYQPEREQIGGNLPPEPIDDDFEAMGARTLELVETANRWIKERPEITDDETAGKAQDFINQLGAEQNAIEAHRKETNAPIQARITANNQRHFRLRDTLSVCMNALLAKRDGWLDKEKERKAREANEAALAAERAQRDAEEARKKAEAETTDKPVEAEVAAKEAEQRALDAQRHAERIAKAPVMARGSIGKGSSGSRKVWKGRVTNWDQVWLKFGEEPKVREALQKLVDAACRKDKGNTQIPGVEPYQE